MEVKKRFYVVVKVYWAAVVPNGHPSIGAKDARILGPYDSLEEANATCKRIVDALWAEEGQCTST